MKGSEGWVLVSWCPGLWPGFSSCFWVSTLAGLGRELPSHGWGHIQPQPFPHSLSAQPAPSFLSLYALALLPPPCSLQIPCFSHPSGPLTSPGLSYYLGHRVCSKGITPLGPFAAPYFALIVSGPSLVSLATMPVPGG